MSDPHIDFEYQPGSNSKCEDPLCCRASNGMATDPSKAAGKWGDYNCDIPHHVLENMLSYVKNSVKPDLFFWTGDNSAHDVWKNTNDEVISYVKNITLTV